MDTKTQTPVGGTESIEQVVVENVNSLAQEFSEQDDPSQPVMLEHALAYARRGWSVIPCWERNETDAEFQARVAHMSIEKRHRAKKYKGKSPHTSHGLKDASKDEAQIKEWWKRWPNAAIGVPTGQAIDAFVLDVDLPDGPESLSRLESEHGLLPPTLEQRTGSGGRQLFFKCPADQEIRNSAGKLGLDLDTRGEGGYVIVPPSGHPSGGLYDWTNNGSELIEAPQWLLDLLARKQKASKVENSRVDASAKKVPANIEQTDPPCGWSRDVSDDVADADLDRIVARCAWLRHCRDDAQTLPEPEWYAALSILGRCKDGARFAHEWSKLYPEYSPAETDYKLRQAIDRAGPRTCEVIQDEFGPHCNECHARVKSPIVLGRANRLPEGFQARTTGIYARVEDKEGNTDWVWMCSPLEVRALTRSAEGQDWGRLVIVIDQDGNAHQWAMPMALLAGSGEEYRRELLSLGLRIAPGKAGSPRLNSFLSLSNPEGRVRCVSRIGWHDRLFVLPNEVFSTEVGESVILQSDRVEDIFKGRGSLAEWQDTIGRYCVGNSRLVLSVSAALAAPLIDVAEAESGGLHLVGKSSLGKTTALVVAGSVCGGGGVRGYILQWRATANGLEGVAAAHCDSLLCLDELSQVTPQAAGETAYMLTNGAGKVRATRQGSARKPAEWRVLFLSTGEITLGDKIREDGKSRPMAGQLVRVVDIDADAGSDLGIFEDLHEFSDGHNFSRHLNEAAKRHYGSPLQAFLKKLTSTYDEARQAVPAFIKDFIGKYCPADADGQVKRVCARFALVAAGGEFGVAYGVLPWPEGEATRASVRCFRDWLTLRGGTGPAEIQSALAQVRGFFQAHGASRFEIWGDTNDGSKTINRVGFRRKDEFTGDWEYYVPAAAFKTEIARGHDAKRLVKELVARGLIAPGPDGSPASGHRIPGQPFARYYRISPSIVSDSSDILTNNVSTVAAVASNNDGASQRNDIDGTLVAPVAAKHQNESPATAATTLKPSALQTIVNDFGHETVATVATAENDSHGQKESSLYAMKPTTATDLWTGPAEVEI